MSVHVLINRHAGSFASEDSDNDAVSDALRAAGVQFELHAVDPPRLEERARELAGQDGTRAIIAAGGDGTISSVASALVETDTPLGVLPLGTRNHLAKDLGLPLDLPGAARVIARGQVRRIDAARVNDRVFLNNSSVGLYPQMVRHREAQEEQLGRGRGLAMLVAAVSVLRRFPLVRVRIGAEDQSLPRTCPFVFVGNNRYEMRLLRLGERPRLDEGRLSVYLTRRTGRFALLKLAAMGVVGLLDPERDFESLHAPEVWVESAKRRLRVSVDGEVIELASPLHYRILPRALAVLA
jgi:diacylglycerol kinase family enzyme